MAPLVPELVSDSPGARTGEWLPLTGECLPLYQNWCVAPLVLELAWLPLYQNWCVAPLVTELVCGSLWTGVAPLVPEVVCGSPVPELMCGSPGLVCGSPGAMSGVWLPLCQNWVYAWLPWTGVLFLFGGRETGKSHGVKLYSLGFMFIPDWLPTSLS